MFVELGVAALPRRLRTRVLKGCIVIASIAPVAASAIPTQSWNGYRWGRVGAIAIGVGDNYSANWNSYVATATKQWSVAPEISYTSTTGQTTSACNMVYGTIQLCSGNYGKTGWVGYTNVQTSGGYIVEATIRLNDYYFNQAYYNNDAWRAETVCQELGNALGLQDSDHNTGNANTGSCTDYTKDPSGKKGTNGTLANLQPSKSDLTNLNAIYAAPGGRQVVPDGIYGSANAAVPEPSSWAFLIAGFGGVGAATRRRRAGTAVRLGRQPV